jgi:DNA helicase-2/ATP-dependent DNA helicase PcrA
MGHDFLSWLRKNTTKEQFEAITYTQGPLLIAAGAGSGKTRVITFKIAYLITNGISPNRILAVTFTNKAAREMQQRVKQLTGLTPAWVRTFHSACVRILRRYGQEIGLNSHFQIATESEQDLILKEISQEFKQAKQRKQAKTFLSIVKNKCFDLLINEQDINFSTLNFRFKAITPQTLFSQYEKIKSQYGYLDFDDLLIKVIELLEKKEQIKKRLQDHFQYILVDEYQDINPAQERILRLLTKNGNITVVGDDYQSIYGFRGAEIKNFLDFQQNYKAKVIVLGCNFRSTKTIVEASSRVIKNNPNQVHKDLYAYNQTHQPIVITTFENEYKEAEFIARKVKELLSKGLKHKDIAILYRSAYISHTLQHELLKAGIPVVVIGDTFFFRRREIKIIILFLRSTFQNDRLALIQLLSENFFKGFGKRGLEKIKPFLEEEKDILEILKNLTASSLRSRANILTKQQKTTLEIILQGMKKIRNHTTPQSSIQSFLSIYEGIWNDFLKKISEDTEQYQERLRNMHEFVAFAAAYNVIDEFLDEIALLADKATSINEKNAVQMLTIHKAKGLEWEAVFLLGADQGIFPSWHTLKNPFELEEERRLFYVAMTRARKFLFITHAEFRHTQDYDISSFVHEIPSEYVRFVNYLRL